MATKSGLVAILNATGDAVIEIRDLGPDPIGVKPGIVKTFEEIRPDLADGEIYTGFTDEIMVTKVKRTWSKAVPPVPVPETISDRQFFQALAESPFKIITQEEALAAVKTGDLPASMIAMIQALPDAAKFSAEMILSGATEFRRSHPLVAAFGTAFGWTSEQIDAFWIEAAKK